MLIATFFSIYLLSCVSAQDRKISSTLNPGFGSSDTDVTLLYVRADGSHDSVHQIWDFTQGIPTTIFAITNTNASLNISWDDTRPTNFLFSEKPIYSFAAIIDKLYEYDDIKESGEINEHSPRRAYDLRYLVWNRTRSILSGDEAMVEVQANYYRTQDYWRSGIIGIKLDLLPYKDYATELPHLIHTANSTLINVKLVNLTMSRDYNASRFALHFVIASTDASKDALHFTMRKSLDDEHTPGVFEIVEIKTPESFTNDNGGFMQFRPVAYTEKERSVATSTNVHVSHFNRTYLPDKSTIKTFYKDFDNGLVQDMFVSFGEGGDGCYKKTNYTDWSFSIGYGVPPVEGFSLFVILVISIGLGVPVVLALSGITYVLVRKYKQRNLPSRLTNED